MRRLFRRHKRGKERHQREEVDLHRCRIDVRKFYQNFKLLIESHKPGAPLCKDENGHLVTNPEGVLRLWKEHFSTLLQGNDNTNTAFRELAHPCRS